MPGLSRPIPPGTEDYRPVGRDDLILVPGPVRRQIREELQTEQDRRLELQRRTADAVAVGLASPPAAQGIRRAGRRHGVRGSMKLYDPMQADKALSAMPRVTRPNERMELQRALLESLAEGDPQRAVATPGPQWRRDLARLRAAFPNFSQVLDAVERHLYLQRNARKPLQLPPMCLIGDAGVGKSQFTRALAESLLRAPLRLVPMEVSDSASVLVGTEMHWASAGPGAIFDALVRGPVINPVMLLDEIDKAARRQHGASALDVLYQLLEAHAARDFRDACLPEVRLDASMVQWIATANDDVTIPAPLRSRMHEFRIPPLTPEQARAVVGNIDAELRRSLRLQSVKPLPPELVEELVRLPPRLAKGTLRELFGHLLARGARSFGQSEQEWLAAQVRSQTPAPSGRSAMRRERETMLEVMFLGTVAALQALDMRARFDDEIRRGWVSGRVH
jgi:ATP-dependent Lon protease